jgi:hypothetical protein
MSIGFDPLISSRLLSGPLTTNDCTTINALSGVALPRLPKWSAKRARVRPLQPARRLDWEHSLQVNSLFIPLRIPSTNTEPNKQRVISWLSLMCIYWVAQIIELSACGKWKSLEASHKQLGILIGILFLLASGIKQVDLIEIASAFCGNFLHCRVPADDGLSTHRVAQTMPHMASCLERSSRAAILEIDNCCCSCHPKNFGYSLSTPASQIKAVE